MFESILMILAIFGMQLEQGDSYSAFDALRDRIGRGEEVIVSEKDQELEARSVEVQSLPQLAGGGDTEPVALSANAVYAFDRDTGKVLYSKNPHKEVPIASITKLMTALVVTDLEEDLDRTITIPTGTPVIEGSSMGLLPGEVLSIRDLLYGLIVKSGNDAGMVLAETTAGSVSNFVKMMNQKARSLGLEDTQFANPTGLDDPENYSSAFDIAQLGNYAFDHEVLKTMVGLREVTVTSRDYSRTTHYLQNTNKLLAEDIGVFAGKTGFTDDAGLCLVSAASRDGEEIINVVLGSEDRAEDTRRLVLWEYSNFRWDN